MAATCARRWSAEDSELLRSCLQVETECLQASSSGSEVAETRLNEAERVRIHSPSSVADVSIENDHGNEDTDAKKGYESEEETMQKDSSEPKRTKAAGTTSNSNDDNDNSCVMKNMETHITEQYGLVRTKRKRFDLGVDDDACGDNAVSSCEVKKPKREADNDHEHDHILDDEETTQARSSRESGIPEQVPSGIMLESYEADADSTPGNWARACDAGLLACSVSTSCPSVETIDNDDDECSTSSARLMRSRHSRRTLSIEYWSRTDECKERKWDHLDEIADQYGCPEDCIYATSLRTPRTAFLEPNLFPYDTPTGIEHWTLWHLRELEHAHIKQYVEMWIDANAPHVKAWNYDDNPERSIDIFHVHVYFQVEEGKTVLQGRNVDDLEHEIDLGVL